MTIRQKQWQLYLLGYYPEPPDGKWGAKSRQATIDIQTEYGITVNGIFESQTEALTRDIITRLQKALTDGKMAIDGMAGMETKSYIEQWQKAHGFTATGIADKTTLNLILSVETDKQPAESVDPWANIKYFSRREFACKCGRYCNGFPVEPNMLLIEQADIVREHFGAPMFVSSGVRCSQHNRNVGGVDGSRHKTGKATDFRVEGKSANTVLKYVKTLPNIRYAYAIDGSYVHMDVY
jgi:peptidoglycan hydrolase-like protein with peptidoglycan-binding domain